MLTGSTEDRLGPPFQEDTNPDSSQAFKKSQTSEHSYKVTENRLRKVERERQVSGTIFREMCVNVSFCLLFLAEDMS